MTTAQGKFWQPLKLGVFGVFCERGKANKKRLSGLNTDELSRWELAVTWLIHHMLWHLLRLRSGLIYGAEHFHHHAGKSEMQRERERENNYLPAGDKKKKKRSDSENEKWRCFHISHLLLIRTKYKDLLSLYSRGKPCYPKRSNNFTLTIRMQWMDENELLFSLKQSRWHLHHTDSKLYSSTETH